MQKYPKLILSATVMKNFIVVKPTINEETIAIIAFISNVIFPRKASPISAKRTVGMLKRKLKRIASSVS